MRSAVELKSRGILFPICERSRCRVLDRSINLFNSKISELNTLNVAAQLEQSCPSLFFNAFLFESIFPRGTNNPLLMNYERSSSNALLQIKLQKLQFYNVILIGI